MKNGGDVTEKSGQPDGFIEVNGTQLNMSDSFKYLEIITSATSVLINKLLIRFKS